MEEKEENQKEAELQIPAVLERFMGSCVRGINQRTPMKFNIRRITKWSKLLGPEAIRQALLIVSHKTIALFHDKNGKRPSFFRVGNGKSWLPFMQVYLDSNHCNCEFFEKEVMTNRSTYMCPHLLAIKIADLLKVDYFVSYQDLTIEQ